MTAPTPMLHPESFQVNEAWIAFKLNDTPVRTEEDGDFNVLALMDAASCFILGIRFVASNEAEISSAEAGQLLQEGRAHKNQLPTTLFVPANERSTLLGVAAEQLGITVIVVPMDQLLVFVEEAREGFRERFGGSPMQ